MALGLGKKGEGIPLPSKTEKSEPIVDRPADKQITLCHKDQNIRNADIGVYVMIDSGKGPQQVERQVEVRDNQVILTLSPEDLALRDVLVRDGFVDKTYYARESKRIMEPSKPVAVYWYFIHPDRSPENPINGSIGLTLPDGTPFEVEIRDGNVETDRQDVQEALIRSGYVCVKTDTVIPKG